MKLVQILARELVEWPDCVSITQDYDGDVGLFSISNPTTCSPERAVWKVGGHIRNIRRLSEIASDHATAIVTSADWEAERARIAAPANANKDGWIRHRGGKCPVEAGTVIEYRERNGNIEIECKPELLGDMWFHENNPHDIMAYRLHKPVEQVNSSPRKCEGRSCSMPDSGEHSKECLLDAALDQGWAGPREWRDRITEIDATTSALATERADLVQKLAGEGFALIWRVVEPVEDMSDPKSWRAGDMLIAKGDAHGQFTQGGMYEIRDVGKESVSIAVDDSGSKTNGWGFQNWEWHSRPST